MDSRYLPAQYGGGTGSEEAAVRAETSTWLMENPQEQKTRRQLAEIKSQLEVKSLLDKAYVTLADVAQRTRYNGWVNKLHGKSRLYFDIRKALVRYQAGYRRWSIAKDWGLWSSSIRKSLKKRARRTRRLIKELGLRPALCECANGALPDPRYIKGFEVWPETILDGVTDSDTSSTDDGSGTDEPNVSSDDENEEACPAEDVAEREPTSREGREARQESSQESSRAFPRDQTGSHRFPSILRTTWRASTSSFPVETTRNQLTKAANRKKSYSSNKSNDRGSKPRRC